MDEKILKWITIFTAIGSLLMVAIATTMKVNIETPYERAFQSCMRIVVEKNRDSETVESCKKYAEGIRKEHDEN